MNGDNDGQWLTTSQASAALGVSERTVTRRCKSGALVARFVAGVWEIDGSAIGQSVSQSDTSNQTIGQGTDTDLNASAANRSRTARQSDADNRPIGQDDRREVEAELRSQLAREREFSDFLKSQLEEANRNTAEIRAALRAAQKQSLPQLTAGESSTIEPAPANRQQRDQTGAAGNDSHGAPNGSETGTQSAESGKVITYDSIADELEAMLRQRK